MCFEHRSIELAGARVTPTELVWCRIRHECRLACRGQTVACTEGRFKDRGLGVLTIFVFSCLINAYRTSRFTCFHSNARVIQLQVHLVFLSMKTRASLKQPASSLSGWKDLGSQLAAASDGIVRALPARGVSVRRTLQA